MQGQGGRSGPDCGLAGRRGHMMFSGAAGQGGYEASGVSVLWCVLHQDCAWSRRRVSASQTVRQQRAQRNRLEINVQAAV